MDTIIWPAYINSDFTRKQGRKLAIKDCVSDPKVKEIGQALKKLKIQHMVEHNKSYPSSWWEKSGRITAQRSKDESKNDFLRNIVKMIKIARNN